MEKIVLVEGSAYGNYSGAEYLESFYITEDFYNKYKDELPTNFNAGELDGKHSEVDGSIEYTVLVVEPDAKNISRELDDDGSEVYNELLYSHNDDFEKSYKEAKDFIKNADLYVNITFKVKKSQIDDIESLVEEYLQS